MKHFGIYLVLLILAAGLCLTLVIVNGDFDADTVTFSGEFTTAGVCFLISILFLFEAKNAENPMDDHALGVHNPIKRRYQRNDALAEYRTLMLGILFTLVGIGSIGLILCIVKLLIQ